jgi:hypothetical protein
VLCVQMWGRVGLVQRFAGSITALHRLILAERFPQGIGRDVNILPAKPVRSLNENLGGNPHTVFVFPVNVGHEVVLSMFGAQGTHRAG